MEETPLRNSYLRGEGASDMTKATRTLNASNIEKAATGLAGEMTNKALANVNAGYGMPAGELAELTGMSPKEALEFAGTQEGDMFLQRASQQKQIAMEDMIRRNRVYNDARAIAGNKPVAPTADDMAFYGADGVNLSKNYSNAMGEYNTAVNAVKDYEDKNIDPGLAAQWASSYKGN